jgi:hypothetical protein
VTKRRRRKKSQVVPRLGPPKNLRPAGAHESPKLYNRKRVKDRLRREGEEEPEAPRDSALNER